jgi:hypothetical protein
VSSESIQIIANNNYEGLQHLNFIFSQKNSVQKSKELVDDETDPKVRRYVGIFYITRVRSSRLLLAMHN